MLEELSLKHLGPIRSAVIAPARGMTAITGETGAGKSMLLSALNLISGGPADPGRVSSGQDEAWAQAVFAVAADGPAEYGSDGPDDSDDGDGSAGKEDAGGGAGAPALGDRVRVAAGLRGERDRHQAFVGRVKLG